jgi:hypothetical protein
LGIRIRYPKPGESHPAILAEGWDPALLHISSHTTVLISSPDFWLPGFVDPLLRWDVPVSAYGIHPARIPQRSRSILLLPLSLPPALSLAVNRDLRHLCIFLCVLRVFEVSLKGSHSCLISEEVIFVQVIILNALVAVD